MDGGWLWEVTALLSTFVRNSRLWCTAAFPSGAIASLWKTRPSPEMFTLSYIVSPTLPTGTQFYWAPIMHEADLVFPSSVPRSSMFHAMLLTVLHDLATFPTPSIFCDNDSLLRIHSDFQFSKYFVTLTCSFQSPAVHVLHTFDLLVSYCYC